MVITDGDYLTAKRIVRIYKLVGTQQLVGHITWKRFTVCEFCERA